MDLKRVGPYAAPVLALFGSAVTAIGLTLGSRLGGPLVRWVFGPPLDFDSDYTSPGALGQAIATLFASLLAAHAGAGALLVRLSSSVTRREAWWVANPASMLGAYCVHYSLSEGALGWAQLSHEYYGPTVLATLVVGAYAFVRAFLLGASLKRPDH